MLEPKDNPNPKNIVDPPRLLRFLMSKFLGRIANTEQINKKRNAFEKKRKASGARHVVEYFHQLDDPYSHLTAQVISAFAERYEIKIVPHLIRATSGKDQPELEKLAAWARRDVELIAPHYDLSFPAQAGVTPESNSQQSAAAALSAMNPEDFLKHIEKISLDMWTNQFSDYERANETSVNQRLDQGSARLSELQHYSGATFYYGGEWYWGVDRLFHLEQRLRDLGACKATEKPYIVKRPKIEATDSTGKNVDASNLELHFYPSLNSPYTSIIFDRTLELARNCNIKLQHKPVLPMIMRGVPATPAKGKYIFFDTKREADFFGVPFGNHVSPIGEPTRKAYSLFPWARALGKDHELHSALLRTAWSEGRGLHKTANLRIAVESAGLDWNEAQEHLGKDDWKELVEHNQNEMVEGMGLWGVPSFKLSGGDEADLAVWGQDRLWLIAAEIRRRCKS